MVMMWGKVSEVAAEARGAVGGEVKVAGKPWF